MSTADPQFADLPCPNCDHRGSKVIESRGTRAQYIRRRRVCLACGYRFSTREMITDAMAARPFVERRLTYIEHAIGKLRNDLDLNPHLPRVDK